MPLPQISDELLQLVTDHVISKAESCSDGLSGQLPDDRMIEINDVDKMLHKISTATSAQAVRARNFFEQVQMSKAAIAVKVITDNQERCEQLVQWFDASGKINMSLPAPKKMKT